MDLPNNATDEQTEELNQKQLFVRDAMPTEWLQYAEELGDAAECLWVRTDCAMELAWQTTVGGGERFEKAGAHARTYVLLAGLALENVLKGMLVARDPTLINQGHLHGSIRSHKLLELAGAMPDLSLSETEQRVLSICQDAIPYWGRYPVPLRYNGLSPREAATAQFRERFRALHSRLCRSIYESIKDGWDSGVGATTLQVRSSRYGDMVDIKAHCLERARTATSEVVTSNDPKERRW